MPSMLCNVIILDKMQVSAKQAQYINEIYTTYWIYDSASTVTFNTFYSNNQNFPKFLGTNVQYYEGSHMILNENGRNCPNLKTIIKIRDLHWKEYVKALTNNANNLTTFGFIRNIDGLHVHLFPQNC